jgi:hypothetical protein
MSAMSSLAVAGFQVRHKNMMQTGTIYDVELLCLYFWQLIYISMAVNSLLLIMLSLSSKVSKTTQNTHRGHGVEERRGATSAWMADWIFTPQPQIRAGLANGGLRILQRGLGCGLNPKRVRVEP